MLTRKFLSVLSYQIHILQLEDQLLALPTAVREIKIKKDFIFSIRDSCSFRLIFVEVAQGFPLLVFNPDKSRALERFYVDLTP